MATPSHPPKPALPPHFSQEREIHVIISTHSGQHEAEEYFDTTLQPFLSSLDLRYSTHTTTSARSIIELTRSLFIFNARRGVKQTIILLSGDGGVIDVVNTLATSLQRDIDDSRPPSIFVKPVVCLVPMGTANALAWSSGCAADPLETMMRGRAKPVPMFEVSFSPGAMLVTNGGDSRETIEILGGDQTPRMYGCVVASWGIHASVVALSDSQEYRKHGIEAFKMAGGALMEENHVYRGQVKILRTDESEWRPLFDGDSDTNQKHAYVLATLVSGLEEKFTISPNTKPLDGVMRIVAFVPRSPEQIGELVTLAYQGGKHVDRDDVVYQEIDRLRIEMEEPEEKWRQICVDGNIIALESGGWAEVRILPGAGFDGRRVIELVC